MPRTRVAAKSKRSKAKSPVPIPKTRPPKVALTFPRVERFLAFNRTVPLLVLALWIVLYIPRPFHLGFYLDDWWTLVEPVHSTFPFSFGRLRQFVGLQISWAARPLSGVGAFLFSSLANSSPFLCHGIAIQLVLLAALSLRAWLIRLPPGNHPHGNLAADLAVMAWLSLPWAIAPSAFLTIAPQAMPAQILLTEAARRFGPPQRPTPANLTKLALLLLASYLTYESFYFVYILLALYALFFHRDKFETKWQMAAFLSAVFGAQVVAVGINRLLAHLNPGGSKNFAASWRNLFLGSLWSLPRQLRSTIVQASDWWTYALCALAAAGLLLFVMALFQPACRRSAAGVFGIFLVGAASLVVVTFLYSLAGYGYSVNGLEARTLHPASWAIAVMFFALVSTPFLRDPGRSEGTRSPLLLRSAVFFLGLSVVAAAGVLIFLNSVSQKAALADWASVWDQEKAILQNAPVDKFKSLPPDAHVLFIGPSYYHGLVIFGAEWDLTAAVFSLPQLSRGRSAYLGLTTIHTATELYTWKWDGQTLFQELPHYWTHTFPVRRFFVWDYDHRTLNEVQPGYDSTNRVLLKPGTSDRASPAQ